MASARRRAKLTATQLKIMVSSIRMAVRHLAASKEEIGRQWTRQLLQMARLGPGDHQWVKLHPQRQAVCLGYRPQKHQHLVLGFHHQQRQTYDRHQVKASRAASLEVATSQAKIAIMTVTAIVMQTETGTAKDDVIATKSANVIGTETVGVEGAPVMIEEMTGKSRCRQATGRLLEAEVCRLLIQTIEAARVGHQHILHIRERMQRGKDQHLALIHTHHWLMQAKVDRPRVIHRIRHWTMAKVDHLGMTQVKVHHLQASILDTRLMVGRAGRRLAILDILDTHHRMTEKVDRRLVIRMAHLRVIRMAHRHLVIHTWEALHHHLARMAMDLRLQVTVPMAMAIHRHLALTDILPIMVVRQVASTEREILVPKVTLAARVSPTVDIMAAEATLDVVARETLAFRQAEVLPDPMVHMVPKVASATVAKVTQWARVTHLEVAMVHLEVEIDLPMAILAMAPRIVAVMAATMVVAGPLPRSS